MPVRQTSYPMAGARRERRLNKARGPTLVKVEAPTSSENEDLVRTAFDAFSKGDQNTVLELVDLDLEWTYLDPSMEDPQPQILSRPRPARPLDGPRLCLEQAGQAGGAGGLR